MQQPGANATDTDVLLTIGERIRLWRERRNFSRKVLAAMIGISPRHLARYENDEIPPPADVLRRLVEVLDVSADYLLGLKERTSRVARDGKVRGLYAIEGRAGPLETQPILAPLARGVSSSRASTPQRRADD